MITERAVLGMFFEMLRQATGTSWIDMISTPIIGSDQDSEDYGWLGMAPQMTQKKGEKKFSQLRETSWIVDNIEYQGGLAFPKKHILYDKTGQVMQRLGDLVTRTQAHWFSLIAPLLINAESTACYDGQFFFDTDHSEGNSGTQSNDISATATTATDPTANEMIDGILKAITTMLAFKDDQGEYVNENMTDFLIVGGTPLLKASLEALSQSRVGGGDTNILIEQDSFRLRFQASPRLAAWTTKVAVFSTEGNQKPIIRQQRHPNQNAEGYDADGLLVQTLWTDSEHYKKNDECLISVEAERAAAYGDWKKSCLVTFA